MFDFSTLFAVTVFVSGVAGLLLLFAWLQNRNIPSLGIWGSAFLMNATAMAMLATHARLAGAMWWMSLGSALWITAHGVMWAATRSFEGRRTSLFAPFAGAMIWLAACQVNGFVNSLQAHIMLASALIGGYLVLCASEVWRGCDRDLVSRWPAFVLLLVHATMFLLRAALAGMLPFPGGVQPPSPNWIPIGTFEMLFHTFCMAVLLVNMAKERAELVQRRASLLDPLTGIANRRAFFDDGEALLARMRADGRTTALLLFDLDEFKAVNDTYGHQAGDQALSTFCTRAQAMLRPIDLFGRYGGEEFACLLPDIPLTQAVSLAERIRAALIERPVLAGTMVIPVTVSVGVGVTDERVAQLDQLFTVADRALYRAKAKGRNRIEVARAHLSVIEATPAVPAPPTTPLAIPAQ